MTTFQIHSLVRDRMVPHLLTKCAVSYTHLTGQALIEALKVKLDKKLTVEEGAIKNEKLIEQLVDAKEIVESLITYDVDPKELMNEQKSINDLSKKYGIEIKEILDMQLTKKQLQ